MLLNNKAFLEPLIYAAIDINPFLGRMLQCMTIKVVNYIPTAGVMYNKESKKFEMLINEEFMKKNGFAQQVAIILHECYHIVHSHTTNYNHLLNKQMANIAMDMVVNQYIKDLPKEAILYSNFRDKKGQLFKPNLTTDEYYALLRNDAEVNKNAAQEGESPKWVPVKSLEHNFDVHDFDELPEDAQKALLDLIRRTEDKMSTSFDKVPDHIQDMIKRIEQNIDKLDYQKLLKKAFRKSMPTRDRQYTWKRPNKRYGYETAGTKISEVPKIEIFADTSGSISHKELNQFLQVINGFLKAGHNKCKLHLFHTQIYSSENYKLGKEIDKTEAGGTDLQCVTNYIDKHKIDLAIILTDGYYDQVTQKRLNCKALFMISDGGTVDHQLKHLGETIKIKV